MANSNQINDEEFNTKLTQQKALSAIDSVGMLTPLEALKEIKSVSACNSGVSPYINGLLLIIGYYKMNEEQQQRIDEYIKG